VGDQDENCVVSVMNKLWAGQPRSCGLILVTNRLALGSSQHSIHWEWGGKVVFMR